MHNDTFGPQNPVSGLHDGCALPRNFPCDGSFMRLATVKDASPCILEDQGCTGTFRGRKKARAKEGEGSRCGLGVEDVHFGAGGDNID